MKISFNELLTPRVNSALNNSSYLRHSLQISPFIQALPDRISFGSNPPFPIEQQQATLLKEINEQPKVLLNLTQKALDGSLFKDLALPPTADIQSLAAVAEGSSFNALAIAKDEIEQLNQRPFSIFLPHDIESKMTGAQTNGECPTQQFPKKP